MEVDEAIPELRRLGDIDPLVRQWADQGTVKRDVAARFLALGEWQRRRRISTWVSTGAPRRRSSELGDLQAAG